GPSPRSPTRSATWCPGSVSSDSAPVNRAVRRPCARTFPTPRSRSECAWPCRCFVGRPLASEAANRQLLQILLQKRECQRPGLLGRLEIRPLAPRLGTQEAVARALEYVGLVAALELAERRASRLDGRVDAGVVA